MLLIFYHGLSCARFHLICTDNAGVNIRCGFPENLRNTAVKTHVKHQRDDNFMVKEERPTKLCDGAEMAIFCVKMLFMILKPKFMEPEVGVVIRY